MSYAVISFRLPSRLARELGYSRLLSLHYEMLNISQQRISMQERKAGRARENLYAATPLSRAANVTTGGFHCRRFTG